MSKRKSFIIFFMLIVSLSFFVSSALSFESITVGMKYWYPQWDLDVNGEMTSWNTDFGMFGPTANLMLSDKYAISASLLTGSFNRSDISYLNGYGYFDTKWDSQRTDLDLAFAWIISPYVNLFGGLKYLTYNLEMKPENDLNLQSINYKIKQDAYAIGPGFGIGGNYPIGETRFSLYGTLSYSYLHVGEFKAEESYVGYSEEVSNDLEWEILSFEAGTVYSLEQLPLVFAGSLRWQQSTVDISHSSQDEKFYGLILYAGYRFGFD